MSKHTPGPWFAQDTRLVGGQVAVVGPNHDRKAGEQGVMVVAHVNGRSGEQGANARLIAAAPDLLALVERLAQRRFTESADNTGDLSAAARELLKRLRATGGDRE